MCKGWFSPDEVEVLHKTIKADNTVDEQKIADPEASKSVFLRFAQEIIVTSYPAVSDLIFNTQAR